MNASAVTQRSIQAVNDLLKQASSAEISQATKLAKVAVQMKVSPIGQGTVSSDSVDVQA